MLFASNCCHFEVKDTTIHWSIHCIQLRGVREQKQFPEPSRPQQSTSPHFSIVLHSLAITVHHCYTALLHSLAITPLLHCYRVLANITGSSPSSKPITLPFPSFTASPSSTTILPPFHWSFFRRKFSVKSKFRLQAKPYCEKVNICFKGGPNIRLSA